MNEEILLPIFKKIHKQKELNGTKELIDINIKNLNPYQPLMNFPGRSSPEKYIKQESLWYNSQDLCINGWMDHIEIWRNISSRSGMINSNYGWCIYSDKNFNQYKNVLEELSKNIDSRRGTMLYSRPKIWKDWNSYGKSDFICTIYTQHYIRNNKLIYIVYQRSCDMIFGLMSDFAHHCSTYQKLYKDLKKVYPKLEKGFINYNISSAHVYKRHFKMLKTIVGKNNENRNN